MVTVIILDIKRTPSSCASNVRDPGLEVLIRLLSNCCKACFYFVNNNRMCQTQLFCEVWLWERSFIVALCPPSHMICGNKRGSKKKTTQWRHVDNNAKYKPNSWKPYRHNPFYAIQSFSWWPLRHLEELIIKLEVLRIFLRWLFLNCLNKGIVIQKVFHSSPQSREV